MLTGDEQIVKSALTALQVLGIPALEEKISGLATNLKASPAVRAQALALLGRFNSAQLPATILKALTDPASNVRITAAGILGKTDPAAAAKALASALATGSPEDHRSAFNALATLPTPEVDAILSEQISHLTAGKVPAMARLELLEAAGKRDAEIVKAALAKYTNSQPKDDALAKYDMCLEGGDAENGRKIYSEHPVAACRRCHTINRSGGEAGPALDGIAARKDKRYLLESIVNPNAQIAESFRMVVCTMKDGAIQPGVIKAETDDTLTIQQPGEEPLHLKKADITSRESVPSGMLPGLGELLKPRELRDLMAYLSTLTKPL